MATSAKLRRASKLKDRECMPPRCFNPMITLKALSYFDDVPALPAEVRERLQAAVEAVDPAHLPVLTPHVRRASDNRRTR